MVALVQRHFSVYALLTRNSHASVSEQFLVNRRFISCQFLVLIGKCIRGGSRFISITLTFGSAICTQSFLQCANFLTLFLTGGSSARLQIVFFITSFRDATEPQNLVTIPKI